MTSVQKKEKKIHILPSIVTGKSDGQEKTVSIPVDWSVMALIQSDKVDSRVKRQVIGARINQKSVDLDTLLCENDRVQLLTYQDQWGKQIFWHSSAHILAQAVLRLYPQALPTIGPPIEEGFYYDFANLKLVESDLEKIEDMVNQILKEKPTFKKKVFKSSKEALQVFAHNPYKCEIIHKIDQKKEQLTAYQQGDFLDLCRGPHLLHADSIKSFKVLKTSGAYWQGDQSKEQLTRVYGISFDTTKGKSQYLHQIAEAKKRDHRVLAKKLDLFSFNDHSPGMPFFHPAGAIIFRELIQFSRQLHEDGGYQEIQTPHMLRRSLWETSGHWDNYQENMYIANVLDEGHYAIKPMNCPGCMLYYKNNQYSHRQFPLRLAEFGLVHRHEMSGALAGLFRVRSFHQDDAHIFLTREQISEEIHRIVELADTLYSTFGLTYHMELSTRPSESIGSSEDWQVTTQALQQALQEGGKDYKINPGDGAFYGPKIDFHIRDCLQRTWQCGTIQLDMSLPERFKLSYINEQGEKEQPIVIHRAILGSVERFMAIVLEHYSGRLPLWLSPVQISLLPLAEKHIEGSQEIGKLFRQHKIRVEIDESHDTIGKKIRNAQAKQSNYLLVIGDAELSSDKLSVRKREDRKTHQISRSKFLAMIVEEINLRQSNSTL